MTVSDRATASGNELKKKKITSVKSEVDSLDDLRHFLCSNGAEM